MPFWIDLWTVLFFAAAGLFALLALAVTIGGLFDIKRLLRSIGEREDGGKEESQSAGSKS